MLRKTIEEETRIFCIIALNSFHLYNPVTLNTSVNYIISNIYTLKSLSITMKVNFKSEITRDGCPLHLNEVTVIDRQYIRSKVNGP